MQFRPKGLTMGQYTLWSLDLWSESGHERFCSWLETRKPIHIRELIGAGSGEPSSFLLSKWARVHRG